MMIYLTVYGLFTEWHMLERQVQDIFMYQPLIRILHISDIQYVVFMYLDNNWTAKLFNMTLNDLHSYANSYNEYSIRSYHIHLEEVLDGM